MFWAETGFRGIAIRQKNQKKPNQLQILGPSLESQRVCRQISTCKKPLSPYPFPDGLVVIDIQEAAAAIHF